MNKTRAFTLIELLVVVAIIGILSSILLTNISGSRGKARDAQRVSDVGQIGLALQLYYDRCGTYPNSVSTSANVGCPSGISLGSFISQIPVSPSGTAYDYTVYQVVPASNIWVAYILHTTLETSNAAVQKGLNGVPAVSGGTWSPTDPTTWACSNSTVSTSYCITAN